jgi:hypothetical protein
MIEWLKYHSWISGEFALSNNNISKPEGGTLHNGNSILSRREHRLSNATGTLPSLQAAGAERQITQGPTDFEQLIQSLHDLFEHDRQIASQPDATRCGICYLHFHVNELHYRSEGFYVCPTCEHSLGNKPLTILRKQQKL